MSATEWFLLLAIVGSALTWNVYRPSFGSIGPAAASFISGWWYGDLAPWVIIIQLLGTAAFAWVGAITGLQGSVGLLLAVGSWLALALRYGRALEFRHHCEASLAETLGPDYITKICRKKPGLISQAKKGRAGSSSGHFICIDSVA